jgi:hypothetical protein
MAMAMACGVGDIARSCVGECAMCIYDADAEEPNCCCDAEVRSIHWSPYDHVGVVNADP